MATAAAATAATPTAGTLRAEHTSMWARAACTEKETGRKNGLRRDTGRRTQRMLKPPRTEPTAPSGTDGPLDRQTGQNRAAGSDQGGRPSIDVRLLPKERPPEQFKLLFPTTILPIGMKIRDED